MLYLKMNSRTFTDALNKTDELFVVYGLESFIFAKNLHPLSDGINGYAKKDSFSGIFCQLRLLN